MSHAHNFMMAKKFLFWLLSQDKNEIRASDVKYVESRINKLGGLEIFAREMNYSPDELRHELEILKILPIQRGLARCAAGDKQSIKTAVIRPIRRLGLKHVAGLMEVPPEVLKAQIESYWGKTFQP